jgi:hypothetical protein
VSRDEEVGAAAESREDAAAGPSARAAGELRAVVERLIEQLIGADAVHRDRAEELIAAMLPKAEVPSASAVLQARRNAAAREALLAEFGGLDSSAVAALAGSSARNRAALAHRWKQEGRIFSVPCRGAALYPGFQFDDGGRPHPAMAPVIAALGERGTEWELALWFAAGNGFLGGRRPADLLAAEPQAVVEAAEREAAGLVF